MARNDIPKAYEAKQYEDGIYTAWEASGMFNPDNLPGDRPEPFSIVLPPPNVTGTLHMGHAAMLAIEDIMVRFERMRGKRALWIPGTDHAAIATQAKVEKLLMKDGMKDPRRELGREGFLARVSRFAAESHDIIVNQARKMGASLDWSREAYTLDAARNCAVNFAFKKMFDDGIAYRGYRVVNWCPRCQSTLADDEVSHKETTAKLYTFKYDASFPISIATTRPETKLGDTAVAVHPEDARYASFVGKTLAAQFAGRALSIRVIADAGIDAAFGTGALGVTPAHSNVDADMAAKNGLETIAVIGEDGLMTAAAGEPFAGLPVREARGRVVAWLREQGLLQKEEDVAQNLSVCYRCDTPVEPLPKLQWFIAVNKAFERDGKQVTLKGLMQDAVRSGGVNIMPERFDKTYFHWIDNLRDWNISRQIWFGHRVPAWYRGEEVFVGTEAPEGEGWTQDEDTFDTWFSSGLWTFSTLGWPDKTKDLEFFHPTSVLETGYDILFFWVARMILMSTYLVGEVPFKTVYLHGLVRDEQGRKMSKSLDNIIDPLDMISKYGADATRLSLVIGSTPGNDQKLSEEKVAGYRNFTNKLWNIARFVLSTTEPTDAPPHAETLADRWILSRLGVVAESVTKKLAAYEISAAGEELRDFTWGDFADWYLEIAKTQKGANTDACLLFILDCLLRLWHPFMPFVTEQIWSQFREGTLMVTPWPTATDARDEAAEAAFAKLQAAVVEIRNIRATQKVEPAKRVSITVGDASLLEHAEAIKFLARVEGMTVGDTPGIQLVLEAADAEAERARLAKERAELAAYVAATDAKLANAEFAAKAPEKVVAQMKQKRDEAAQKLARIESQLVSL